MSLWTDIPQQIWKANFFMWFIYLIALVCSVIYFLANRQELFIEYDKKEQFISVLFWAFIVPFVITLGFGFIMYGGIGILYVFLECV